MSSGVMEVLVDRAEQFGESYIEDTGPEGENAHLFTGKPEQKVHFDEGIRATVQLMTEDLVGFMSEQVVEQVVLSLLTGGTAQKDAVEAEVESYVV